MRKTPKLQTARLGVSGAGKPQMANHPNRRKKAAIASYDHSHEHDYSALLTSLRASFAGVATAHTRLFATDATGLNDLYLDTLPAERQVHNCSCCRQFIERFGGLVAISEDGQTIPAMWNADGVPEFYHATFSALYERVKKAKVVSVFFAKKQTWGTPETTPWTHMAVTAPAAMVYRERALTAGQAMAANKENVKTVRTALAEFTAPMLDQALRLLQAESLARSERFIGPVKWLRTLQDRPKGRIGENILWRAVALAPEGYCHPKASVIGPLLDDIAAGLPFADIKARFDAKMHPLLYQRPQAAPTAGNIKAAEALMEKLGLAPALERRYARLDEIQTIWLPRAKKAEPKTGGVFAHLKPKDSTEVSAVEINAQTITWEKFARTVLPSATAMHLRVPARGRFIALTTAVNADAPPILKWDRDDARNPFAWYVYHNGSDAAQWGLVGGSWTAVTGASLLPPMWGERPMPYLGDGVVLVLENAIDTREAGNALFPECLKEDIHGVRATIEAYSRGAKMAGREEASACGYDVRKGAADCQIRVNDGMGWATYRVDRWD